MSPILVQGLIFFESSLKIISDNLIKSYSNKYPGINIKFKEFFKSDYESLMNVFFIYIKLFSLIIDSNM